MQNIKKVYCQNINCEYNPKIHLLPIGLANSMFTHGDILSLYTVMRHTYYNKKFKNLYVNINPNTYSYRQTILNELQNKFIISQNKSFNDYLEELSSHYFSLCIRGNGIDTHRFGKVYI